MYISSYSVLFSKLSWDAGCSDLWHNFSSGPQLTKGKKALHCFVLQTVQCETKFSSYLGGLF